MDELTKVLVQADDDFYNKTDLNYWDGDYPTYFKFLADRMRVFMNRELKRELR